MAALNLYLSASWGGKRGFVYLLLSSGIFYADTLEGMVATWKLPLPICDSVALLQGFMVNGGPSLKG